jgi:hypothetical protein
VARRSFFRSSKKKEFTTKDTKKDTKKNCAFFGCSPPSGTRATSLLRASVGGQRHKQLEQVQRFILFSRAASG